MIRVTTCSSCGVHAPCWGEPARCVRAACQEVDDDERRLDAWRRERDRAGRFLPEPREVP